MKKLAILFALLFLNMTFISNFSYAQEKSIKFDGQNFELQSSSQNPSIYKYFTKKDKDDNFHEMISLENFPELTNHIEAAANYAHKVQEENKGAAVLVYPETAIIEFINFPSTRDYYEYNAIIYTPSDKQGVNMYRYAKRFYASENDGSENARTKAITFAQENSTKSVQSLEKVVEKYKID